MATVFDVADWFLHKPKMTHKKLQKLYYYAQAWSYAIFPEPMVKYSESSADTAEPDIRCLCALADFFGVSVDYIVGHEVKTDLTGQMRKLIDSLTPEQVVLLCTVAAGTMENSEEYRGDI